MDKLKNFSIEKLLRSVIDLAMANKNIVVSIIGISLIGYTMFNTLTKLETKKDEAHFQQLQDEVVITRFDEEVVEKIRELDDFQESIDSQFTNDRNNPFVEGQDIVKKTFGTPTLVVSEELTDKTDDDFNITLRAASIGSFVNLYYRDNGYYPSAASKVTYSSLGGLANTDPGKEFFLDSSGKTVQGGEDKKDGGIYYRALPQGCGIEDCTDFNISTTNPDTGYSYSISSQ